MVFSSHFTISKVHNICISLTDHAYATLFLYQHFRLSILQKIYSLFHGAVSQC